MTLETRLLRPLLSVIVPVYNVAPYLDQCLGSILSCGYSELEVIVVDDGSTDGSPALCDAWAERDARLRVIHQPNAGQSAARNRALEQMRGDYFTFVDADDWVAPLAFTRGIAYLEEHPEVGAAGARLCRGLLGAGAQASVADESEPLGKGGFSSLRSYAGTTRYAVGETFPHSARRALAVPRGAYL